MGRTNQTGLSFFSFDVDFFEDDKIMLIEDEFGTRGIYVLIRLLCRIYKDGYYYKFGDDECRLFSRKLGIDEINKEFIDKVVDCAVRRGFFSKQMFEQQGILTSHGIQNRYLEATRRFKEVVMNNDYLLIPISKRSNVITGKTECEIELQFDNPDIRDRIYEIFFFKNYPEPSAEIDRFYAYYEARGWMDSNGNGVTDKVAIAEFWEPAEWKDKKQEQVQNCPVKLLADWKKAYMEIKTEIGEEVYTTFLKLVPVKFHGNKLLFRVGDKSIYEMIESNYLDVFRRALQKIYGNGIKIEYTC